MHEPQDFLQIASTGSGAVVDGDLDGKPDFLLQGTSNFVPGIWAEPCLCGEKSKTQVKRLTPDQALHVGHAVEAVTRMLR